MTRGEAGSEIERLLAERKAWQNARAAGEVGPDGADPDVWQLTLAFVDRAERDGIELAHNYDQAYAALMRRIGTTRLRQRPNWVELVQKMITEFWDNDVQVDNADWAVHQFTGVETFSELARWAIWRESADAEDRSEWTSQDEYMAKIRERGQERRAKRKADREAAIARMQTYEDPEVEREIRDRARKYIDEAMKEFSE